MTAILSWLRKPPSILDDEDQAVLLAAADEIESLRKDLLTAHFMVAKDAHDAPGRITSAIRPFLAGAVERHGIAPSKNGSEVSP